MKKKFILSFTITTIFSFSISNAMESVIPFNIIPLIDIQNRKEPIFHKSFCPCGCTSQINYNQMEKHIMAAHAYIMLGKAFYVCPFDECLKQKIVAYDPEMIIKHLEQIHEYYFNRTQNSEPILHQQTISQLRHLECQRELFDK